MTACEGSSKNTLSYASLVRKIPPLVIKSEVFPSSRWMPKPQSFAEDLHVSCVQSIWGLTYVFSLLWFLLFFTKNIYFSLSHNLFLFSDFLYFFTKNYLFSFRFNIHKQDLSLFKKLYKTRQLSSIFPKNGNDPVFHVSCCKPYIHDIFQRPVDLPPDIIERNGKSIECWTRE